MLVTDSQFNVSDGKLKEKKTSLWSRILFSLANGAEKESDQNPNQMEREEIYRIC